MKPYGWVLCWCVCFSGVLPVAADPGSGANIQNTGTVVQHSEKGHNFANIIGGVTVQGLTLAEYNQALQKRFQDISSEHRKTIEVIHKEHRKTLRALASDDRDARAALQQKKAMLEKQLTDIKDKLADVGAAYQKEIQYLQDQIDRMNEFRVLVSDKRLKQAQEALAKGDETIAKAIFTEISNAAKIAEKAGAKADYSLGQMAKKAIDYSAAFGHFQNAVRRDPRNPTYLLALGQLAQIVALYDQAIDVFEKALAIQLNDKGEVASEVALLWNELGLAWDSKGEYDKAIAYYEKALASDLNTFGDEHPDVAIDWNNLGLAWKSKGEYDKAIAYYEKALASDLKTFGDEHPKVGFRADSPEKFTQPLKAALQCGFQRWYYAGNHSILIVMRPLIGQNCQPTDQHLQAY